MKKASLLRVNLQNELDGADKVEHNIIEYLPLNQIRGNNHALGRHITSGSELALNRMSNDLQAQESETAEVEWRV